MELWARSSILRGCGRLTGGRLGRAFRGDGEAEGVGGGFGGVCFVLEGVGEVGRLYVVAVAREVSRVWDGGVGTGCRTFVRKESYT